MTPNILTGTQFGPMTANDLGDVLALEQRAFDDPWNAADFGNELSNPRSKVELLRSSTGVLLGHVVFWTVIDQVEILDIAVDPACRRHGLGRRIMRHVIDLARSQACKLISLEVRRSNTAAVGLYQSLGFKAIAVRPRYYAHDNEDAIVMQLGVEVEQGVSDVV
jgi:ribosomal-protein-alanine N-acetyltransferase